MNNFGRIFRLSIFGESHGSAVGVVIDGCPAGIPLEAEHFRDDFIRRKSGAPGTTPRKEGDIPEIISGVYNRFTTGTPVAILIGNKNVRSSDYEMVKDIPRPGHADFIALKKYGGFADLRGGGHFSGRLTTVLVAAGVIAKKICNPVQFNAKLIEAGGTRDIEKAIQKALNDKDSIGGIVECRISNVPVGLGEPFFDSIESMLSHIIFSIPAIKGIEFGSGFSSSKMKGSEHNDTLINTDGQTRTNHSGGINGGVSNGNELIFRVAVKPTSSIALEQKTINVKTGKLVGLKIEGRHDTCIALRIPVVVEAAAAIVLADFMLIEQKTKRINK